MYNYIKSSFEENNIFFDMYFKNLSGIYDNFLEDHILKSQVYKILSDDMPVGYFAIFENTMLTQFFIEKAKMKYSQTIFEDILNQFKIVTAFVPTCDELFLSLSLDYHKKIEKQAYFFEDSKQSVRPAEFSREFLYPIEIDDIPDLNQLSDGFFDFLTPEKKGTYQIYVLRHNDEIMGFGLIEDCHIFKGSKAIGMCTVKEHRQKGVGRSVIIHLKDICSENGFSSLPGCWYYNHNSKKTLESAGFITKTRLLKVFFQLL